MVTTIAHAQWKSWNYCQRGAGDHCWHLQKTKLTPSLLLVACTFSTITALSLKAFQFCKWLSKTTTRSIKRAIMSGLQQSFYGSISLPMTSIVKLQVALFPDWSTAVYVITWIPWLNLWSGWWFDVTAGRIPELSVAAGSVQFTCAENRPCSAYTTNELDGQVAPNVGGRISAKWKDSSLATTP